MPFGSTSTFTDKEWVNGVRRATGGRHSCRVTSCATSTRTTARSPAARAARSAGCPRAATGRSTSRSTTARVLRRRELVRLPAARAIRAIFGSRFSSSGERSAPSAAAGRAELRKLGTFFWFYPGRPIHFRCQNAAFARELARRGSLIATSRCSAATTGRSGATTRAPPTTPRRRGSRMARAGRSVGAAVLALGVLVAATGWLYVARPLVPLPGPGCTTPSRSTSSRTRQRPAPSLPAVWGAAAVAARRCSPAGRAPNGSRPASCSGPAVGGWLYALNGVSILVVRQISAHEAFHAAAAEQAVVIPAALAGIARRAARAASRRRPPARAARPRVVVAGVGVLAAVDAVFPEHRRSLVTAIDAAHVHGLSKALVVPLAVALVVTARSLGRGNRRAWQIAVALLALLLALHVERRFDEGAIVTGVAVVALLARRGDFRLRGDPATKPRVLAQAIAAARRGRRVYGLVTLWVNRLMADEPYTLVFALRVTGRALAGLSFRGGDHLSGPSRTGSRSRCSCSAWGAVGSCSSSGSRRGGTGCAAARTTDVVRTARRDIRGADTLAPFALRADKSYFFAEDERRSSPTASSAASRSSRATRRRGGRALRARPRASSTSRTSAAGASPCSGVGARLDCTARSACARSTTATRRSSRRRRSRSRAGRSARCGSRSAGCRRRDTRRACCARARSTRRCARSSRRSRASGAATRRSAAS